MFKNKLKSFREFDISWVYLRMECNDDKKCKFGS